MASSGDSGSGDSNTTSKYFPLEVKTPIQKSALKTSSQPSKRTHSEVSEASESSGDEIRMILNELSEIKTEIKSTVKTKDLDKLVHSLVNTMVGEMKKELKKEMDTELKNVQKAHENEIGELKKTHTKERTKLYGKIDSLEKQIVQLVESNSNNESKIRKIYKQFDDLEEVALEASVRSNYNEQYSRKHNIKIHGVKETAKENTTEVAKKFLNDVANVVVKDSEIVAIHRIPGKKDKAKPILVKVQNTDVKARVMRQRPVVKDAGYILSDDVTKQNSDLIQRLNDTEGIYQAWYFNGSVYAQTSENGRRLKFDIHDDIYAKLKEKELKEKRDKEEK